MSRRLSPSRTFTVLATGFCLAVGLWDWLVPAAVPAGLAFDVPVTVQGTVTGEVEQLLSGQRATLKDALVNGQPTKARLLVRFEPYPALVPDDRLSLSCALKQPQPIQDFRYDRYLAARGIFALCSRPAAVAIRHAAWPSPSGFILRLKSWLVRQLGLALPEPAAAFLSGLVFGGSSGLSSDLQDAFSATGTSHVLAASGSNVSLITAVFLAWALERFGRRRAIPLTAAMLAAYVVMAGAVPAVLRAALMASVLLVGAWTRRRGDAWNVLLAAVVVMLALQPRLLLDDPGFQLSVAATVALMTLAKSWEPAFALMPEAFEIRTAFVTSLAASVMTVPISLWHFGSLSLVGPFANLALLPFVPLLVGLGLVAFAAAAVHPALGTWIGLPAWAGAVLFLRGERLLASVPFAQAALPRPHVWAVISCVPVILLLWRSTRSSPD